MGKELQTTAKTAPPSSSFHTRGLRGKCACGSRPGFDGDCGECRKKKLRLQRRAAGQAEHVTAPPVVREVLSTPGQPLDGSTLAAMQSRFGHHFSRVQVTRNAHITHHDALTQSDEHNEGEANRVADDVTRLPAASLAEPTPTPTRSYDLSHVRIHTDRQAARSASAINALAYTVGRDIVFAAGQYAPWTVAGRLLLAHELTHVIQQTGLSLDGGFRLRISRKPATAAQPAEVALETALKSDNDDEVRDLTKIKAWPELKLSGEDSATLIIYLLEDDTGDEDEEAGLEILNKNVAQGMLDDTLIALDDKRRFGQLLDDYDGSEYYQLINLLADNIRLFRNRAIFLDKLIEEDRVNQREEQAVVTLLINTPPGHRVELLEKKGREQVLRNKIDDKRLLTIFEKLVVAGIEQRAKQLYDKSDPKWREIFDEQAKTCKKEGMKDEEAEAVWNRAMLDLRVELANELIDYHMDITAALDMSSGPLTEEAPKINQEFKGRLNDLIARKKKEFCLELKYDVEFNRGLNEAYRTVWTEADLKTLDQSLEKVVKGLPQGFLQASLNPASFLRDKPHTDKPPGGETLGSQISLVDLGEGTAAHELGHVVHNEDSKLLEDFQKLSGWEELKNEDVEKRRKTDPDFGKLIDRVSQKKETDSIHRKPEDAGEAYTADSFFYLVNRYASGYLRYPISQPAGAGFVSNYAATHPKDDFAESFCEYVLNPDKLRESSFIEKYKFLRLRVFIKYLLAGRKNKLLARYDAKYKGERDVIVRAIGENDTPFLMLKLHPDYFDPMREQLSTALAAPGAKEEEAASKKDITNRYPLDDSKEAEPILEEYLLRLDNLAAAAKAAAKRYGKFKPSPPPVSAELAASLVNIIVFLKRRYAEDLMELIRPLAERISRGERVKPDQWPELDALAAKYENAHTRVEPYLPLYRRLTALGKLVAGLDPSAMYYSEEAELDKIEWTQLKKLPVSNPRRQELKDFISAESSLLDAKLENIRNKMLSNIRDRVAFNPKDFDDPDKLFQEFKDKIASFAATLK